MRTAYIIVFFAPIYSVGFLHQFSLFQNIYVINVLFVLDCVTGKNSFSIYLRA